MRFATASGLDFIGSYNMDLDSGTSLRFNVSSTVITEYDSSEFGAIKGSRNFSNGFGSTPELKLNGGVTWSKGDHLINFSARHIGSYNDDQTGNTVDSQTTIDARYQVYLDGFLGGKSTTLGIGVTNILDEGPPALSARPLFDTQVHDPRGRQVYVTLKHTF